MKIDRREFIKDAGILTAVMGLSGAMAPQVAEALEEMATGRAPIVWLQGQACTGCSVSLLNAEAPNAAELITRYISLYFHQTIGAATGDTAMAALHKAEQAGDFILVVEGTIPEMREACVIGHESFYDLFANAARKASAVIAVGTCAAHGGVAAAPPNRTKARTAEEVMKKENISVPLINIPGCPAHPAWIVGNLVQALKFGLPKLDSHKRPLRNFKHLIHDQCPLYSFYINEEFAIHPGDEGCLFKLGCQGVITKSDCPMRGWNGGTNWCVRGKAPCVGCAHPDFSRKPDFPFYRLNEEILRGDSEDKH